MRDENMPQFDELPLACTLEATDGAARLARWRALSDARLSVRRTPDQLIVRYRSQRGVQQELEALVAAERQCCSFADWEVTRDSEHVLLRIRSDAQGLAAIVGAFGGI
jgi:ABC-type phosphonate transport system ATPase subunit